MVNSSIEKTEATLPPAFFMRAVFLFDCSSCDVTFSTFTHHCCNCRLRCLLDERYSFTVKFCRSCPIGYIENQYEFYHISTNEIPGDFSRENMISSHARSPLLWLPNKWSLCPSTLDTVSVFFLNIVAFFFFFSKIYNSMRHLLRMGL